MLHYQAGIMGWSIFYSNPNNVPLPYHCPIPIADMARILHLIVTLAFCTGAFAQEWTGAVSTDWNDPANWSAWPLDGEDIDVSSDNLTGLQLYPVISAPSVFTPDLVIVEGGMLLTITGTLTVDDRLTVGYPAVVSMTAGQLTADRLIVEGGGSFSFSGGTIDVGSVLAIVDGGINGPSTFDQSGGTVNVTGALEFECETGDFDPQYLLSDGLLYVTGDVVWFGEAPGSGRPRLWLQGGDATVSGSLLNTAASTVDMDVRITTNSQLTVAGPNIDMVHANDNIFQNNANFLMTGDVTWRNNGGYHAEYGIASFSGNARLEGEGTFDFWQLGIGMEASLDHVQPDTIAIGSAFSAFGEFEARQNTVAFTGPGGSISGFGTTAFHNLIIDHTAFTLLMTGTNTVAGTFSMLNGTVTTTPGSLTLLDNATVEGGSSASFVNGPMRKIGDDDFSFPVGKSFPLGTDGQWRRISVIGNTDGNAAFTAEFFADPYFDTSSLGPGIEAVSNVEHWRLSSTGASNGARVALYWEDAAASGLDGCDGVTVASWDGLEWQATASTVSGSCTANSGGSVATVEAVDQFDVFTIGNSRSDVSVGPGNDQALPGLYFTSQAGRNELYVHDLHSTGSIHVLDIQGRVALASRTVVDASTIPIDGLVPGPYVAVLHSAAGRIVLPFIAP